MKKILMLFVCLFVLAVTTTHKSSAETNPDTGEIVNGPNEGLIYQITLKSNSPVKSGKDLVIVLLELGPNPIIRDPYSQTVTINGVERSSIANLTEAGSVNHRFIISAEDLPKFGINGNGKHQVVIKVYDSLDEFREIVWTLEVVVEESTSNNEKPVDEGDKEPTISADTEAIEVLIEDLASLQEDILAEFEDSGIRALRSVSSKINRVLRLLEGAVDNASDGDPNSCSDDLQDGIRALETVISRMESKSCATKQTKRCIPEDLVDEFIPEFEDILDELDTETLVDDNEDGIPDVCGI